VTVSEEEMFVVEEKFIFSIGDKLVVNVCDKAYELAPGQGLVFDGRCPNSFLVGPNNQSFAILSLRPDTLYDASIDDDSKTHIIFKFGDLK